MGTKHAGGRWNVAGRGDNQQRHWTEVGSTNNPLKRPAKKRVKTTTGGRSLT